METAESETPQRSAAQLFTELTQHHQSLYQALTSKFHVDVAAQDPTLSVETGLRLSHAQHTLQDMIRLHMGSVWLNGAQWPVSSSAWFDRAQSPHEQRSAFVVYNLLMARLLKEHQDKQSREQLVRALQQHHREMARALTLDNDTSNDTTPLKRVNAQRRLLRKSFDLHLSHTLAYVHAYARGRRQQAAEHFQQAETVASQAGAYIDFYVQRHTTTHGWVHHDSSESDSSSGSSSDADTSSDDTSSQHHHHHHHYHHDPTSSDSD